jgi:hypothetical protein
MEKLRIDLQGKEERKRRDFQDREYLEQTLNNLEILKTNLEDELRAEREEARQVKSELSKELGMKSEEFEKISKDHEDIKL